jgi:hypothetical protein
MTLKELEKYYEGLLYSKVIVFFSYPKKSIIFCSMKLSDTEYSLFRELQQNEKHKRNYVKITYD